jgi:hypothetical protein
MVHRGTGAVFRKARWNYVFARQIYLHSILNWVTMNKKSESQLKWGQTYQYIILCKVFRMSD